MSSEGESSLLNSDFLMMILLMNMLPQLLGSLFPQQQGPPIYNIYVTTGADEDTATTTTTTTYDTTTIHDDTPAYWDPSVSPSDITYRRTIGHFPGGGDYRGDYYDNPIGLGGYNPGITIAID